MTKIETLILFRETCLDRLSEHLGVTINREPPYSEQLVPYVEDADEYTAELLTAVITVDGALRLVDRYLFEGKPIPPQVDLMFNNLFAEADKHV